MTTTPQPSLSQTPLAGSDGPASNPAPRRGRGWSRAAPFVAMLIASAHIVLTGVWMHDNGFFVRNPRMDAGFQRNEATELMVAFRDRGFSGFLEATSEHSYRSPPGIHAAAAISSWLDGTWEASPATLWRAIAPFGFIMALGTWLLARNFGGRWFACLVVFLTVACPIVLVGHRLFYRQFPMASWVPLILHCLVRSQGLTRPLPALLAGFFTGVACCFKELTPLYVGGAAVVAAACGLLPSGRRLRAVLGVVLGLVGLLIGTWWWYGEHWELVYDYITRVTGDSGQAVYSSSYPMASFARWLYYPVNWMENGAGFFPCVLLFLGVGAALFRLRARGPAAATTCDVGFLRDPVARRRAVFILVASPLLAYPVLTVGQVSAHSQYTMPFAPLFGLALAATMRALPTRGLRRAGLLLAILAAVWQSYLAYRPLTQHDHLVYWGEFAVVARGDMLMAKDANDIALNATPTAEPWPVREFAETILRTSPTPVPRLALLNRLESCYCAPHHIQYEAWRMGGLIQLPRLAPQALGRGPDAVRMLEATDFLVINHGLDPDPTVPDPIDPISEAELRGYLLDSGLPLEVVACKTVTPRALVSLLRVVRKGARPPVVPRSMLDDPNVVRVSTRFDNGWTLLGYEVLREPDGAYRATTFWDAPPPSEEPWTLTAGFTYADKRRAPVLWKSAVARPFAGVPDGSMTAVVCDPLRSPLGVRPATLEIKFSRRDKHGGFEAPKILAGKKIEIPLGDKVASVNEAMISAGPVAAVRLTNRSRSKPMDSDATSGGAATDDPSPDPQAAPASAVPPFSPGDWLLATSAGVRAVSPSTGEVRRSSFSRLRPRTIMMSPDNEHLIAAASESGLLSVLSSSASVRSAIPVAIQPTQTAIDQDGSVVGVGKSGPSQAALFRVDLKTGAQKTLAEFASEAKTAGLCIDGDTGDYIVTGSTAGSGGRVGFLRRIRRSTFAQSTFFTADPASGPSVPTSLDFRSTTGTFVFVDVEPRSADAPRLWEATPQGSAKAFPVDPQFRVAAVRVERATGRLLTAGEAADGAAGIRLGDGSESFSGPYTLTSAPEERVTGLEFYGARSVAGSGPAVGGSDYEIRFSFPGCGKQRYLAAVSTAIRPGTSLNDGTGRFVGLAADGVFAATLGGVPGIIDGFSGELDAAGRATGVVRIPPGSPPGIRLFVSAVAFEPSAPTGVRVGNTIGFTTN